MTAQFFRLHVGAHKTATTYIQETLLLNRAESAAAGTAYWPLHTVRKTLAVARQKALAEEKRKIGIKSFWSKNLDPKDSPVAGLKELFVNGYSVTISEENILGNSDHCHGGTFYSRASIGLELFSKALGDRPAEVLLAIRSYAPFLASIYAESLRHGMFTKPEKMIAANKSCEGQWLRVIDGIQSALPYAKIVVWRYEDFAKVENAVLARLSGLPAERLLKPQNANILPSASKEAIEHMIDQAGTLAPNQRVYRMLALNAKHPRSASRGDKFMPFSQTEQAILQREYETDLAAIEARDDVELLS